MASTVASRRVLRLQEYGSPSDFHLSKQELENLATANSRWSSALGLSSPPLRIELTETGARLRAEGVTGVVRVGGIDIEIAPKFLDPSSPNWQSALWRILAVAEGGGIVGSLTSGTPDNIEGLPDVLADVFLESFRRGSTRGFPNGYRTVNSSGTVVRGSFDTSRISEWLAAPWRIPFITDQLVEDTPLSRIVRWTARVLSSSVSSCQMRVFGTGVPVTRYCRVPGSWYRGRADGVGPAVCLIRPVLLGRWPCACRSLRCGFGGRC